MKRKNGFTLMEVMIAVAIAGTLFAAVFSLLGSGTDTYELGTSMAELESEARRVVERIADEVMSTGVAKLNPSPIPPLGSFTLTFQKCTGYDLATYSTLWGTQTKIEFQYDPSDPNEGQDNNHNGVVDEGVIVCTYNVGLPTQQVVDLGRNVREYLEGETFNGLDDNGNGLNDERGLSFELVGETLTIRLTLERLDPKGQVMTRTVSTSVKLRN